jgi:hypothetical protein
MKNVIQLKQMATHKVRYTDCDGDNNVCNQLDVEQFARVIILKCAELSDKNENILEYFGINKDHI